jgi:2-alkyl-3-oxoalkanoate reductase
MADKLNVVTGANGLLGTHIAKQLVVHGERVRAVLRHSWVPSNPSPQAAAFPKELPVETATAELADLPALRKAVRGAAVVYHCAARVSDWGPWRAFKADNVDGTRNLLQACQAEGVRRVLCVSSLSVFGCKLDGGLVTEESSFASVHDLSGWDCYGRSKILAEQVVRRFGSLVTVIRPSWCYGPHDRAGIPRFIDNLRRGRASIIGSGDNRLNIMHARDAAAAAVLAANQPHAAGQSYNLNGLGDVTQVQLVNALTDAMHLLRLEKCVSLSLALRAAFLVELIGRLICKKTPPRYTRRAVARIARTTQYSTEKAQRDLGWQPRVTFVDGIQETMAWFLASQTAYALSNALPGDSLS